jgi:PKD repeat protein
MLKDSPYSDAKALLVTFSEVSAHVSGAGGFNVLPFAGGATSRTCDLKKLTAAQDVLGTGTLAAGHYTQIRLVVTNAVLYFDNASAAGPACAPSIAAPAGANAQVSVSSGDVKLNREFDVTASGATTILVDFDGDQSVHAQGSGQYNMTPVISVVSVQ